MPIERLICIQNVSKEVFDVRDKIVMRCAYDAQNALGRLCDEKVYEKDLTRRLRANRHGDRACLTSRSIFWLTATLRRQV